MSRYASAGLSGSARSPRARREAASSRKRSRRSGALPVHARVAASVHVAAIVTRRAARTMSSVRRRRRVTGGMVQQSREGARAAGPRPLPDPGAGLALLPRRRALHVLPRHRPHLPSDRPRHHQGRAVPPRAPAARLHAALVPRPHAAHGAAGGRAAGRRPPGRRSGDHRVQGGGRQRVAALSPGGGGRTDHHDGHGRPHAGGEPDRERGVPAPALPHPPVARGERTAGARLQRDVRRRHHLCRGRERLAGGPARPARLRRARPEDLAHHHRARGAAAHRRDEPAHHAAPAQRCRQRGGRAPGRPAAPARGRAEPDGRRRRGLALPLHELRHLRHEPVGGLAAQERAARGEAREGPVARRPARPHRRARPGRPRPGPVRGRAAQAVRLSDRRGRSIALAASLVILVSYYMLMTSLEGFALAPSLPAWVAIWTPNILFGVIGLTLLVATAREWRAPRLLFVWRALAALRRLLPRAESSSPAVRAAHGPSDSTHILDRYLMREFLAFLGIGLAVAAALYVIVDLGETLNRFLRVKPPLMYIFEHFLYRLPAALHEGLPVIMLVATIFVFLSLSRFHELTAMKAAGISLYRVSAPILLMGLSVAVSAMLFQELFLPRLNELGEEVDRVKIRGQLPRHLQSRQRLWLRSSDSRFYRIELLSPQTSDLYGVTILEIDRAFRLLTRLDARHAHWTEAGWELRDGDLREVEAGGTVQTVPFTLTALELAEDIEEFTRIHKNFEAMSYWELRDYVARLEAAGFQVKKYLVALYSKLSFPLVNLVMVLVAIPFALQAPRGGRLFGVGLAIAIMAGYLVVHFVALAFARADLLPPLVAAWTANVIFFGLGTSLFLRART